MENMITDAWLKANGFRLVTAFRYKRTQPEIYLRRRAIKGDGEAGEKNLFQSPEDLCIDIAPSPYKNDWVVWLFQADTSCFIHVRQFRYQKDLIRLYEVLTGVSWKEMQC